jgi:hypothetical protein
MNFTAGRKKISVGMVIHSYIHSFIHPFILLATDVIQGINHEFHSRKEGDFIGDGHSFIHPACNRCNPRN